MSGVGSALQAQYAAAMQVQAHALAMQKQVAAGLLGAAMPTASTGASPVRALADTAEFSQEALMRLLEATTSPDV